MERLTVVGATYRNVDAPRLGDLTLEKQDVSDIISALAADIGARGALYLGTCNRVELIIETESPPDPGLLRSKVYHHLSGKMVDVETANETLKIWGGEGAIEHLFLVAAGMDSAQLGEREIYLQFRKSLRQSREAGLCSPLIDRVVVEAMRTARAVHAEITSQGSHNTRSLAQVAASFALSHIARLERTPGLPRIGLIGVSPMTRACFEYFKDQDIDIVVANRTPETAEVLVAGTEAEICDLDTFKKSPGRIDAVVAAISVPDPVLGLEELKRIEERAETRHHPLLIDLGVPPNIDPDACEELGIERIGMQQIISAARASREALRLELAGARRIIDESLEAVRHAFGERIATPVISGLNDQYRYTLDRSVDWLLSRELSHLSDEDKQKIRHWSEAVAKRCAHIPIMGVKAMASHDLTKSVETFLKASESDLVETLHSALEEIEDFELGTPTPAE